jgi:hypothetical protein
MDYPDRWKQNLADDEEREEIAKRHWRPTWWQVALLVATALGFGIAFWPRG